MDAEKLDYHHQLERERVFIALMKEAQAGLRNVVAGRHKSVQEAKALFRVQIDLTTRAK